MAAWPGYSPLYRIASIKLVTSEELSYENGTVTRTMKLRRPMIRERFQTELSELLAKLQ